MGNFQKGELQDYRLDLNDFGDNTRLNSDMVIIDSLRRLMMAGPYITPMSVLHGIDLEKFLHEPNLKLSVVQDYIRNTIVDTIGPLNGLSVVAKKEVKPGSIGQVLNIQIRITNVSGEPLYLNFTSTNSGIYMGSSENLENYISNNKQ